MLLGPFCFVSHHWSHMAKYYQARGVKLNCYQDIAKLKCKQIQATPELVNQLLLLSIKYKPCSKLDANLIYGEVFYNQSNDGMTDHTFCATPTSAEKVYLLQTSPWRVERPQVSLVPMWALSDLHTFGLANYSTVINLYYYRATVKHSDYVEIIYDYLIQNRYKIKM